MMITIKDRVTGEIATLHPNSLLDDAKAQAEAIAEARGGLRAVQVSITTDRGRRWLLVPRTRNTGPGRYVWERA